MDGARGIEVGLGRAHLDSHSKALQHLVHGNADAVQANDLDGVCASVSWAGRGTCSVGLRHTSFMDVNVLRVVSEWYPFVKRVW